MEYIEITRDGYTITTDPAKMDAVVIHGYLVTSYWAAGIPKAVVEKCIANSLCFGIFYKGGQVGFARLVTDKATIAYLGDVFILEEHRGRGLSKWMMEVIHAHPEVQGLRRWILATRDAHSLYEQFGWVGFTDVQTKSFMQKHYPDVYKQNHD